MEQNQSFVAFLDDSISSTSLSTQEIIDLFVPFLSKLNALHQDSKISPLKDVFEIKVVDGVLSFDETHIEESHDDINRLNKLLSKPGSKDLIELIDGYTCWEFENFSFYDQLSDIYIAGLMLASLALDVNLRKKEDFRKFKDNFFSLHSLSKEVHPVIYESIKRMVKLERSEREPDLESIIYMLTHYEEQVIDEFDIEAESGEKSPLEVLSLLQNRLYDFTKRNRLIYFKETQQVLNLTEGSISLQTSQDDFDIDRSIIWNEKLLKAIKGLSAFNLSDCLLLGHFPWLNRSLTAIRATANKDLREYGFSQLRLCIAFLNWYNLKEDKTLSIKSPLLLIPVTLKKKKGVRDSWLITFQSSEAVVNPALKEHLFQLFGLTLPDTVDLEKQTIESFYETVKSEIKKSEPKVILELISRPNVHESCKANKKRLKRFEKRSGRKIESTLPDLSQQSPNPEPKKENHKRLYWEFDLSSTTLGNFNYRKMTLVRDYKSILQEGKISDSFEKVFTDRPLEKLPESETLNSFQDIFHILPADPTQMAAVDHAQNSLSYIIQGPPGTGKSQTISNLIADFTARDKRILFVCEKRAALDVVYHRLGQAGLKKLCCLIHDSQDDKKEFIKDLKDCYETLSLEEDTSVSEKRLAIVSELDKVLMEINTLYKNLNTKVTDEKTVNDLISRAVEVYHGSNHEIPEKEIPNIQVYEKNKIALDSFFDNLKSQLKIDSWYKSPFSTLNKSISEEADPEGKISEILEIILPLFESVQECLAQLSRKEKISFEDAQNLLESAVGIQQLKEKKLLFLLDKKSHAASDVYKSISTLRALKTKAENATAKNINWNEKLNPTETERAISIAQNSENSLLRFLKPSWWKLRKVLKKDYDFSAHKLPPSWSEILNDLNKEHKALARVKTAKQKLCSDYHFSDVEKEIGQIDALRDLLLENDISCLKEDLDKNETSWESLNETAEKWLEVKDDFCKLFHTKENFAEAINSLAELKKHSTSYHLAHPVIEDLGKLPHDLYAFIINFDVNKQSIEYEILVKEAMKYILANPDFKKFDYKKIESLRNKYSRHLKKLHKINARYILEKKSGIFSRHLKVCNSPAAELTEEEKEFKKVYNRGRKELEHEFNKKMRYKSIRDLAAEDSGQVVKDLKPIWLMSPLSVSDTIPLDEMEFDAVIFDEASQIVIEEAIPTLYRSKQFIIVGDEKQLPPTSFFNIRNESSEALNILNADSLLSVASLNVPSSMLGWHYRSKNEWLISFSNSAFYKRRLLTVPEIVNESHSRDEINVISTEQAINNFQFLSDRPISFHFMENGVYENRRNSTEAEYIAQLVWEYLRKEKDRTLGIVAFSESQQREIEASLEKLAEEDDEFAEKYMQAIERTQDGHYEGLFVKNLENVQGDERDIMILSICYGKNHEGKMRMNFGPINQKGGEKRLNVIVTRARRHVAVVSSIKGDWITNDYNEGALCFKRYLKYAEAVSTGNSEFAEFLLDSMSLNSEDSDKKLSLFHQYSKGLPMELKKDNVGTSGFRVPLGLGQDKHKNFELALFDVAAKNANAALEMAFMRPALLEAFGWQVNTVTSKDILLNSEKVKDSILENLDKS